MDEHPNRSWYHDDGYDLLSEEERAEIARKRLAARRGKAAPASSSGTGGSKRNSQEIPAQEPASSNGKRTQRRAGASRHVRNSLDFDEQPASNDQDRSPRSGQGGMRSEEPARSHVRRNSLDFDGSTRGHAQPGVGSQDDRSQTGGNRGKGMRGDDPHAASQQQASSSDQADEPEEEWENDEFYDDPRYVSRPKRKHGLAFAIVAVIAVLALGAVAAFAYTGSISGNLHAGVGQDLRDALADSDMANEPFYVLLLGSDRDQVRQEIDGENAQYRTDSMMLARVDAANRKVSLISIPRDTLVDLGEYGWQKVNAAYAFGGPSLAVKTVSKLANVDISHYAEIDLDGLAAAVDALGGIEVEVPIDIDDWEAGGAVSAGLQTLDGWHALILCRSRNSYVDTSSAPDLMRAANQRLVLSAIAHKMLSSDIGTIANMVNSISKYVTTDLELNEIIGLAQIMQGLDTANDLYTAALPTTGAYISGGRAYPDMNSSEPIADSGTFDESIAAGYYLVIDDTAWKTMMDRMKEGLSPSEDALVDAATGTVLSTAGGDVEAKTDKSCWITVANGTDDKTLGKTVEKMLIDAGYKNVVVTDATPGFEYPDTLVMYNDTPRAFQAKLIAEALGKGEAMENDGDYILSTDYMVIIGDDWNK